MKPTLAIGIIAKNESRDLPKLLESIKPLGARVVLVDTGSTDNTMDIAIAAGCITSQALGASEFVDGEWLIQDFSKARNHCLYLCHELNTDWIAWLDADDVLLTPNKVLAAMYMKSYDYYTWIVHNGSDAWPRHHMYRRGAHFRFEGRCHEYPALAGSTFDLDVHVRHDATPHPGGEDANKRNLRLLTLDWNEKRTPRTAFYIANTHKDGGRFEEAAGWYLQRLSMGQAGFRDEWLFAALYQARCFRALKRYDQAAKKAREGRAVAPDWAEFIMEEAHCFYEQGEYAKCISAASQALDKPIPPTPLWREPNQYRDQPARFIAWCHKHLGNNDQAVVWGTLAKERIVGGDPEWDKYVDEWRASAAPAVLKKRDVICLRRAGAIGDVLMTLNLLPALREANPGMQIHYFTSPALAKDDALGSIIRAAGADMVLHADTFEAMSQTAAKSIELIGYPLHEGYPHKPMTTHLLHYFAHEMGLRFDTLPSLVLPLPPKRWATSEPYATRQWRAGWSKYKEWNHHNWDMVDDRLADIPFVNIDEMQGLTLQDSIGMFAHAAMHVGIDSFCNHLTNYRWFEPGDTLNEPHRVHGVILWGSTQVSAAGYPTNRNISKSLPCQPCFKENPAISRMDNGPCINVMMDDTHLGRSLWVPAKNYDDPRVHACMGAITVEEVVRAIRETWEQCT